MTSKLSKFLSRDEWPGIGVFVAIIAIIVAILSSLNPKTDGEIETKVDSKTFPKSDFFLKSEPDSSRDKTKEKVAQNPTTNLHNLDSIVNAINASNQDNLSEIYEGLIILLGKSNTSDNLINTVKRWKEPLTAKTIGNNVVISTMDQYKIDGFILFFNSESENLIFASYDFGLGIKAIKAFETRLASPEYLISVKYMTQSGTGLYGESVRIYAVGKQTVATALDKPYTEYIDGSWGAYKSNVSFEQNNKLVMDSGLPKLTTIGRVTYTKADNEEVQVDLPKEEYIWDLNGSVFEQVSGRQTKSRKTMSEMYADFAEPNGDWFEAPRDSSDTSFTTEQW